MSETIGFIAFSPSALLLLRDRPDTHLPHPCLFLLLAASPLSCHFTACPLRECSSPLFDMHPLTFRYAFVVCPCFSLGSFALCSSCYAKYIQSAVRKIWEFFTSNSHDQGVELVENSSQTRQTRVLVQPPAAQNSSQAGFEKRLCSVLCN